MKILFINSIYEANILVDQIGTLNLATILNKESGHDAEIIDFNYLFLEGTIKKNDNTETLIRNMAEYILIKKPDIVGFSCMCNCYHIFVKLSQYIRIIDSNIKIFFGGPQASLTAKDSLEAFPWIDIVALGEGEETILNIINALENKELLGITNGVAFRDENKIIVREATYINNLNTLVYPDYSLLPYFDKLDCIQMEVGRGCPFSCTYCSTKTFWKRKFRVKSVERILEEVEILYYKFGKKNFNFIHDLFTVNRNVILEFCDKITEKKLKINWTCSARIDTLDEELIHRMSQCGCVEIFIGIETGSKNMQKLINKNLNLDVAEKNIHVLKQSKMEVTFSFIYGFPKETLEDLRDTIFFIKKLSDLGFKKIQIHQCSIFAGTEMYEIYKKHLVIKDFNSDTLLGSNLNYYKDIIMKYLSIFPQYYDVKNYTNTEQYKYLPEFVIYSINYLKSAMPQTYRLLLSYYNEDILSIYDAIKNFDEDLLKKLSLLTQKNQLNYAKILSNFIKYNNFGDFILGIRNIYSYELDFIEFKVLSKDKYTQVKNYDIDVLKVENENLLLDEIKQESTYVMFKNIDNINVGIKKVSQIR